MSANPTDVLDPQKWLYFKIYRRQSNNDTWRTQLDWYHDVLRTILKPWIQAHREIGFVFFSVYGPEAYAVEGQAYEKQIPSPPSSKVSYIRLRAFVPTNRGMIKGDLVTTLGQHTSQVHDYEILDGYKVRDDLGNRYARVKNASIDDEVTVSFVRYWDAACRYILEILGNSGNWDDNVDVWGVPHLVNNSIGAWLRVQHAKCPNCIWVVPIALRFLSSYLP